MIAAIIISALALLIGILIIESHLSHSANKVDSELIEIQIQLDKQVAKLNSILSQLSELQSDNEVIDHNLHTIIGNISNLKDELK